MKSFTKFLTTVHDRLTNTILKFPSGKLWLIGFVVILPQISLEVLTRGKTFINIHNIEIMRSQASKKNLRKLSFRIHEFSTHSS